MELKVKNFLLDHSFNELEERHGVCARVNATFDKVSLNYDQILARNGDPIAEQCRGLVVRPRNMGDWSRDKWKDTRVGDIEVLAWPMNRFYNHGDAAAAVIDWNDPGLRVYEKVDGTCIVLYWDSLHEKWHCATRSVPEADLPIHANDLRIGDMTFAQLFLHALAATRESISGPMTWTVTGPDKVIHLNKEMTYVFELVSPHNHVVVNYEEPRVYLLAVRHTATGIEIPIESVRIEHVLRPKTWAINDVMALAAFVDMANPAELEGAVACSSTFDRLKVKNKSYVLAHKSKDHVTSSPRNALQVVILEKVDDIIPLVPDDVVDKLKQIQDSYLRYCTRVDDNVRRFKEQAAGSRKSYALMVNACGDWTAPYFNLWEDRARTAREWIKLTCEKNKLSTGSLDTILSRLV